MPRLSLEQLYSAAYHHMLGSSIAAEASGLQHAQDATNAMEFLADSVGHDDQLTLCLNLLAQQHPTLTREEWRLLVSYDRASMGGVKNAEQATAFAVTVHKMIRSTDEALSQFGRTLIFKQAIR